jgi:hypothetical protein
VTDRKPFEPIDGVTPRWRKLYDLVLSREVGDEITYREAVETLDLPGGSTRRNRAVAQNAMRDAQCHLENQGQRTVGTRMNFGWVVLDGQRELQQVDRRLVKTSRAAGRTLRGVKALGTRREELSQFERERLDQIGRSATLARQMASRRNLDMDQLRKMIETK